MITRRRLVLAGIAASPLLLVLFFVLWFQSRGGVYIGTYPKLNTYATTHLVSLHDALSAEAADATKLLSQNEQLRTDWLDGLQRIATHPEASRVFVQLATTLQLQNRQVALEVTLNSNSFLTLRNINAGILERKRYEILDPLVLEFEQSFTEREPTLENLASRKATINELLEMIRTSPPTSAEAQHFAEIKMICGLQASYVDQAIEQHSKKIRPTVPIFRRFVDEMAIGKPKASEPRP